MRSKQLKILFFLILLLFIFPASSFAEKTVVIDPGHGGKYSGTYGYSGESTGFCEETANLLVGLKVREILQNTDIKVVMTRDSDREFSTQSSSADLQGKNECSKWGCCLIIMIIAYLFLFITMHTQAIQM